MPSTTAAWMPYWISSLTKPAGRIARSHHPSPHTLVQRPLGYDRQGHGKNFDAIVLQTQYFLSGGMPADRTISRLALMNQAGFTRKLTAYIFRMRYQHLGRFHHQCLQRAHLRGGIYRCRDRGRGGVSQGRWRRQIQTRRRQQFFYAPAATHWTRNQAPRLLVFIILDRTKPALKTMGAITREVKNFHGFPNFLPF
jgi:hypothetical protein